MAHDEFLEQFDRGVGDEPEPDPSRVLRGSSVDSADRAVPKGPLVLHGAAITPHGAMSSAYVLVDGGKIVSLTAEDPGAGEPWETNGVIVPGLIDMHNHPNYNVFAAWEPPKLYQHRAAWRGSDEYDVLVKQPQKKLAALESSGGIPKGAQLRYGEVRALVGGVTAIQGANDSRTTAGPEPLVRNVDRWIFGQHRARTFVDLPFRTGDIDDFKRYQADPQINAIYLHLCEGKPGNSSSDKEFKKFVDLGGATSKTVVIHGTSLTVDQIDQIAAAGCKVVWSPQSNLRLYGETTNVSEMVKRKIPLAIGADWLPSGSTSLLAELKVAQRVLAQQGSSVGADALVAMVTSEAAKIAGLGEWLGVLDAGRPADLVVFERHLKDPYDNVVAADPSWVDLVMIGGDICYLRADAGLIEPDGTERLTAWGKQMLVDTRFSTVPGSVNPSLADVRAALIANYPSVGPIFA
jgi:5-methylthioadenosine/S-adenosylhomocysteine deaminase